MRLAYTLTCAFIMIILVMCAGGARKSDKEIGATVNKLMLMSTWTVFTQLMIVGFAYPIVARVFYSLYYISIDYLLYYLLRFCYEYTRQPMHKSWWDYFLRGAIGIDSVMILGNIFGGYISTVDSVTVNGELFFVSTFAKFYQFHLFLCYVMFVTALLALFRKIANSDKVYWVEYVLIALVLIVIVGINLVYIVKNAVVDYSMLGYICGGLFVYYFSINRVPRLLVYNMISSIIADVKDGIVLFDVDGNCIFANNTAKTLLGVPRGTYHVVEMKLLEWLNEGREYVSNDDFMEDTYIRMVDGEKISLHITSQAIKSHENEIGNYYKILNYTKQVELHQRERYLAFHDPLTGVYNQTGLYEVIERRLRENPDKSYYLLVVDIRDFKGVNEVLGRKSGDELLIRVAKQLAEFETLDAVYGRLTGDKFGIMLERKYFHAGKISKMLNELKFTEDETSYMVILHMGVYEIQENDETPIDIMFDRAAFAISKIKNSFEERIAFYDEIARRDMMWEQSISSELNSAIEFGQFIPYLQPQINTEGFSSGAEVLVRWAHPTEGLLLPGRFIEIFEKNGMILNLDRYVWERACQILRDWKEKGYEDYYLSVNISPKDIYLADVCDILTDLVEKYEVSPKNLRLEITETMIVDTDNCIDLLSRLQEYGFIIEMDDFGSGYSSLNTLKNIPVDVLKLDLGFLRETHDKEKSEEILSFVIELSKRLHMGSIAEGIETEEQYAFLRDCGCEFFQGYFFSQPIPIYEYEKVYIKDHKGF